MAFTSQKFFAGIATLTTATSIWLYLDNRKLRDSVDEKTAAAAVAAAPKDAWKEAATVADTGSGGPSSRSAAISAPQIPVLPEPPKESKLEKRARRTDEFAAMFGRLEGETEEEYKARVMPLIKIGLDRKREQVKGMREEAEKKAGVTAAQHAALDKAFNKTFTDVLDYTNTAIKDGQLSPYERNVSGWLEFAGGLGGMLNEAQGGIGKILSPEQIKAMSGAGFEWGEYLGASAPWENLHAPPPPKN
jgi:hypothetical protein